MKRIVFIVLASIVVAGVAVSFAQGPEGQRGRGRGGPGGPFPMMWLADATDAQREQAKAILDEARGSRQEPPPQMTLRRQLEAALLADAPDDQQIQSLQQQLAAAEAQALAQQVAVERKIAQILTPEQRATLRDRLAQGPPSRH
jgi:Spy/CpxP family protein refolding chaperone